MNNHYDLNVIVRENKNWASLQEYAHVAQRLKITGLGIDISSSNYFSTENKYMFTSAGTTFFSRLTITAQKSPQIKQILAKNYKNALIIAIETNDLEGCKWAAHDKRVDLITIDPTQITVDKGLANLLKIYHKPVELIFTPLFQVTGSHRSRLFRAYYKIINLILKKHIKLVISSGATSIFDLRGKRETMAIGNLLEISKTVSQDAISEIPDTIIQEKLETIKWY